MFPLSLPAAADLSMTDTKFQVLKSREPSLPPLTIPPCPMWTSLTTIKLISERVALQRNPHHCWDVEMALTKSVQRSLIENYQWRA